MPDYFLGLDLGQSKDYTALIVAERVGPEDAPCYDVGHIERVPLNTYYPAIVEHVGDVLLALRARPAANQSEPPRCWLACDYTGVGRPVMDMIRAAELDAEVVGITIHGGDAVTEESGEARVPKRDLAGVVQVLLQAGRLRIAQVLPLTATLTQELVGFRAKISLSGHDSYGAGEDWRSAPHDDLVLALALACWLGERERTGRVAAFSFSYLETWCAKEEDRAWAIRR